MQQEHGLLKQEMAIVSALNQNRYIHIHVHVHVHVCTPASPEVSTNLSIPAINPERETGGGHPERHLLQIGEEHNTCTYIHAG